MQTRGQTKSWDSSRFRQEQWVKPAIVVAFNSLCTIFLLKLEIFFGSMTFWPRGHYVMFKHFHTDHWSKMKTKVRRNKRKKPGNRPKTCNTWYSCRRLYLFWRTGSKLSFTNSSWFHQAYGFVEKKNLHICNTTTNTIQELGRMSSMHHWGNVTHLKTTLYIKLQGTLNWDANNRCCIPALAQGETALSKCVPSLCQQHRRSFYFLWVVLNVCICPRCFNVTFPCRSQSKRIKTLTSKHAWTQKCVQWPCQKKLLLLAPWEKDLAV